MDERSEPAQKRAGDENKEDADSGDAKSPPHSPTTISRVVIKNLTWRPKAYPPDHPLDSINEDLCRPCRRLFQGTGTEAIDLTPGLNNGAFFEHLDGYLLEKSARNGCTVCTIVWNGHRSVREFLNGEELSLRYDYGWYSGWGTKGVLAVKFYPFDIIKSGCQMMPRLWPVVTLTLEPAGDDVVAESAPTQTPARVQGTTSTGSPEVMAQIARWLQQCACAPPSTSTFAPERLLDVDASRAGHVLVVKGSAVPGTSRYIALSHCWGTTPSNLAGSSKLVQANIDRFMSSGIPLRDLPKTFSDAVSVARSLNVRYLWIDSLCIAQDSKEDWERNAAAMWEIYTNSYVTIAATASRDSSQGLFRTRIAATVVPSIVRVPESHPQLDGGIYRCYDSDEWNECVEFAALNKRGWVLQERLLSPRIIHFAETQVFFECWDLRASERLPSGIPARGRRSTLRDDLHRDVREKGIDSLIPLWASVVWKYTSLQLSHDSDKIVAVSAISRQLMDSIPDSGRYVYGLWEYSLAGQLCWSSSRDSVRCSDDRAPSWSWCSMNGFIRPNFIDIPRDEAAGKAKAIAKVLGIGSSISSTSGSDSIAHGTDRYLRMSAPLLRIKLVKPEKKEEAKDDAESLEERRSALVNMMRNVKTNDESPGYTGENLVSYGASSDGLPTGRSGKQRFDIDVTARLVAQQDGIEFWEGKDEDNPKRSFPMDLGGSCRTLETDQDFEWEELEQLKPVFMPVFCEFETTFHEIEILSGLVLVGDEASGVYRRIGVATLDEYSVGPFLCNLGNQEGDGISFVPTPLGSRNTGRIQVEDFIPGRWAGKELDFYPKDLVTYEVTIA
jgi:hypothetical protein